MTKLLSRSFSTALSMALALPLAGCSGTSDGPGAPPASGGSGGSVMGSGGATAAGGRGGQAGSGTGGSSVAGSVSSGGSTAAGTGSGGAAAGGTTQLQGGSSGAVAQGGAAGTSGAAGNGGAAAGGTGGISAGGKGGDAGSANGGKSNGGKSGNGGSGGGSVGQGGSSGGGTTGAGGSAAGGSGGAGTGKSHIFLLFGQSNMAGYAPAKDTDKVKNTRIEVIGFDNCNATGRKQDQWAVAVPPLHECGVGAVGPGDWFSKTLIDKLPAQDTIALVPCALSGQAISVFSKGTDKYTWIVNRVKNAQQRGGVVDGMLFHQGESDCGNSGWPAKVKQLVSDLRTDLNLSNVPFFAGELPYDSACNNHNPLVNQLPGQITNAFVVSAQGLKLDPADTQWHMHFGHDDTVEFGKRYAAKVIEVLKL